MKPVLVVSLSQVCKEKERLRKWLTEEFPGNLVLLRPCFVGRSFRDIDELFAVNSKFL